MRSSGSESWTVGDNESVATLSFHPTDNVLMIGASNAIYFWDWSFPLPFASVKTNSPHEEVSFFLLFYFILFYFFFLNKVNIFTMMIDILKECYICREIKPEESLRFLEIPSKSRNNQSVIALVDL